MIALACFHLNRSDLAVHVEGRSYSYPINQITETAPLEQRTDGCNLTHRLRMKGSPASKFMNEWTFRGRQSANPDHRLLIVFRTKFIAEEASYRRTPRLYATIN